MSFRIRIPSLVITFILLLAGQAAVAESPEPKPEPEQSFQTCGLITAELFTLAQLMMKGATADDLIEVLPKTVKSTPQVIRTLEARMTAQGAESVLLSIHQDYARCARRVYRTFGLPPKGSAEYGYQVCAGESRIRTEIIMAARMGATADDVLPQLPETHHELARELIDTVAGKGALAALDHSATLLKRCMNRVAGARSE